MLTDCEILATQGARRRSQCSRIKVWLSYNWTRLPFTRSAYSFQIHPFRQNCSKTSGDETRTSLPSSNSYCRQFSKMEEELNRLSAIVTALPNAAEWEKTVNTVARSVVSIYPSFPVPFDTKKAYCSEAIGFAVDVVVDAGIG